MYVFKDSGACLFGCARLSHNASCCGPPTASPLWHRCTVGVLAGTHRCALMPNVASRQSANPSWLLECGLVNVSSWSSKQSQRDFTALLLYAFRVPRLTAILDFWTLECENTYTPARRVALFCEHFVAPTSSAGCKSWMFFSLQTFFQQILIDMLFISFEVSLHLSCLLPAMPLSILFTPDADPFHSQEIAQSRMLSWNCCCCRCCWCAVAASIPVVKAVTTRFMFRVSISFCNSWQYPSEELRSQTPTFRLPADALVLGCLVLDCSFS